MSEPSRAHDGAALLDELQESLTRYVALPSPETGTAVVLWIAATHAQTAFQHATRLVISSPEKRCGKSRLLDIIEATCHKPLMAFNATVPALFRSIDPDDPPTLLLDEADAIWSTKKTSDGAEDMRALINAGFGRGRPVLRCVGPNQIPTEFSSFAMAALAGIGDCLPDTVTDRAVRITMRRRKTGETVRGFRQRRDADPLHSLRDRLGEWVTGHIAELTDAEPVSPLEDRAADTWEPLLAIADLAGHHWPATARTAALVLTEDALGQEAEGSIGVLLLSDIRQLLMPIATEDIPDPTPRSRIASSELVRLLHDLDESPWRGFDLNQNGLARRLRNYDVRPGQIRLEPDAPQVRGYKLEDFLEPFARYLPSQAVTPSQSQVNTVTDAEDVTPQPVTDGQTVTGLTSRNDGVTARDTPSRWRAGECELCGNPLDPVLIRQGDTVHPTCAVNRPALNGSGRSSLARDRPERWVAR
jgi:hypothetical protein